MSVCVAQHRAATSCADPTAGAVFNKLATTGYYAAEACRAAVEAYFAGQPGTARAYGFLPKSEALAELAAADKAAAGSPSAAASLAALADALAEHLLRHADIAGIVGDAAVACRGGAGTGSEAAVLPPPPGDERIVKRLRSDIEGAALSAGAPLSA